MGGPDGTPLAQRAHAFGLAKVRRRTVVGTKTWPDFGRPGTAKRRWGLAV